MMIPKAKAIFQQGGFVGKRWSMILVGMLALSCRGVSDTGDAELENAGSKCLSLNNSDPSAMDNDTVANAATSCESTGKSVLEAVMPAPERCSKLQAMLDNMADTAAISTYLRTGVEKQEDMRDMFLCAGEVNQVVNDAIDTELLRGDGWGSVVANRNLPFWNEIQSRIGRAVWGGKVLHRKEGKVRLLNMMMPDKTMRFAAEVVVKPSLLDGRNAMILDYRKDNTVGQLSEQLIRRVRDELRELKFKGQPTRIYVGRANIFRGSLSDLDSGKWDEASSYIFGANFVLDFRDEMQKDIPSWATDPFRM